MSAQRCTLKKSSSVYANDAMAILLACICHNVHAMLLLQKSYWTTRSKNNYAMTFIKLTFIGQGVFKFIVPCEMQKKVQSDAPQNTVQDSDDDMDLEEDLAEIGLLPSDKEDSSNEASSEGGNANVNDSRENNFDGENIDNHSDAGYIVPLPVEVPNTDNSVKNVEQPLNSTMGIPNSDNSVVNVDQFLNSTMDIPNTDNSVENVDQSLSSTMDVSNTDKTLQGDTRAAEAKTSQEYTSESSDNDGYVSDGTQDESDVMFVRISVPDKPEVTIVGKV